MSRGYGAVQRDVLAQLNDGRRRWLPLGELGGLGARALRDRSGYVIRNAAYVSRYESVRRAVAGLAEAGVVETRMVDGKGYPYLEVRLA